MQTLLSQFMQKHHNIEFSPEFLKLLLDRDIDLQIKEEVLNEMLMSECYNLEKWLCERHQSLISMFENTPLEDLYDKVCNKFLKGQ